MKKISSVIGVAAVVLFFVTLQAGFSSCKKEVVRDTLYIKDTIRIKDTVHVVDSSNCSCYNLSDGLVAYYNFNNGNLNDSSGNNNNIVFSNAVKTTDRFGRANNAYLFNGSSNYMQVKNSSSLNPSNITISAFVRLNGFYAGKCHGNQILQKGTVDQEQGVYALRVTDLYNDCAIAADTSKEQAGGFFGDYGASSGAYDSSFTHTGRWIHLVYTYDGHQSKLYVDGKLKITINSTATFSPGVKDVFIGRAESSLYPYWFNGVMDDIRIYNKALCEAAIKQLYSVNN